MRPLCPNRRVLKAFVLALASSALISCNPSPNAGGGIGGTGSVAIPSVSSGAVTKLGSVFISGVKYDNSNAFYCTEDQPCGTQNNLKVGMVVQVKGTAQSLPDRSVTRIAETVAFHLTAAGVVQSVSPDGSSLIVLGQFIAVNPKTVIDESIPGQAILNLRPGVDVVQISGLVAGDGHIVASLIMKRAGATDYIVEGIIKNHDPGAKRFEIGQLLVDYSSTASDDITVGEVTTWNDRLVYVRGEQWQPLNTVPYGGILSAMRVKALGLTVDESPEAKLEGFITKMSGPGSFAINNHPILVSSDTVFEDGTANELVLGTHVLIHGTLVQGNLDAQLVSFQENLRIESNVESVDLQSATLTLAGLPGLLIETDGATVVENAGTASRLGDLRTGDHINIHAKFIGGQRVLATTLQLTAPSNAIVLHAPVQSAADPQLVLADMRIDTSAIPDHEFAGTFGPIG
ncbi:MAG TPA: DUF5666 domain-containing protein, partial [Nitrospiraceae bacterium]